MPPFNGESVAKRSRKQSTGLTDAFAGAAVAFAKTLGESGDTSSVPSTPNKPEEIKFSPCKVTDLRLKNFEQLKFIQQLYKDEILTKEEYVKQKENILSAIEDL